MRAIPLIALLCTVVCLPKSAVSLADLSYALKSDAYSRTTDSVLIQPETYNARSGEPATLKSLRTPKADQLASIAKSIATTSCAPYWHSMASPEVSSGDDLVLKAVSVIAEDDAWAVGAHVTAGRVQPLVVHWTGSKWIATPTPQFQNAQLWSVAGTNSNDIWAVGDYDNGYTIQPLVLHWNGNQWQQVMAPEVGLSGSLHAVTVLAADDVWAAGGYSTDENGSYEERALTMHWNGTEWLSVNSPSGSSRRSALFGMTSVSAKDIWAVGYDNTGSGKDTLIQHWDGSSWSLVPSPNPAEYNELYGVDARQFDDVWAVGYNEDGAFSLHWTGAEWDTVPFSGPSTDDFSDAYLYSVKVLSPQDVWAVGYSGSNYGGYASLRTLIVHWDGVQWSRVVSPNGDPYINKLYAIETASTSDMWAVGTQGLENTDTVVVEYATPSLGPIDFTDVADGDYFYEAVTYLSCAGVVSGYADNTFRPQNNTTRGQLSKIVVLAEGFPINTVGGPHFQDVPEDSPFFRWIETAYNHGLVSGYADGTFRPQNNVTRGQLCKIIVLAEQWPLVTPTDPTFVDVPEEDTFYPYVETAYDHNVISGYTDKTFKAGNPATRGQIAKIVYRAVTQP